MDEAVADADTVECYLTAESRALTRRIAKQLVMAGALAVEMRTDDHKISFECGCALSEVARCAVGGVAAVHLRIFDHALDPSTCALYLDVPRWALLDDWLADALPRAVRCWERIHGKQAASWALIAKRNGSKSAVPRSRIGHEELLRRGRAAVQALLPGLAASRYTTGGAEPQPDLAVQISLSPTRAVAGLMLLVPQRGTLAKRAPYPRPIHALADATLETAAAGKVSIFDVNLRPDGTASGGDSDTAREVAWVIMRLIRQLETDHATERRLAKLASRRAHARTRHSYLGDRVVALACAQGAQANAAADAAADAADMGDWLRPLLLPLPVPCAYLDQHFLPTAAADAYLASLADSVEWEGGRGTRPTAVYGDAGVQYWYKYAWEDRSRDRPSIYTCPALTCRGLDPRAGRYEHGYASQCVHTWTTELRELRDAVNRWHEARTGHAVDFNVCLLNRYDDGAVHLGWHADREEIDPLMDAPRASPIASLSLGAVRRFGFQLRADRRKPALELGLGHGSLLVMENACQLLYLHSLLPETMGGVGAAAACGLRINLTFRSRKPTLAAPHAGVSGSGGGGGADAVAASCGGGVAERGSPPVFVGLTPGIDHTAGGFKRELVHPFESVFVADEPAVAAARYKTWLLSQPAFARWVVSQLRGRRLTAVAPGGGVASTFDAAHARMLAAIVAEWAISEGSVAAPLPSVCSTLLGSSTPQPPVRHAAPSMQHAISQSPGHHTPLHRYAPLGRLHVAPMAAVTDRHCRMLHRAVSPLTVVWTEMTWDRTIIDAAANGTLDAVLGYSPEEHPIGESDCTPTQDISRQTQHLSQATLQPAPSNPHPSNPHPSNAHPSNPHPSNPHPPPVLPSTTCSTSAGWVRAREPRSRGGACGTIRLRRGQPKLVRPIGSQPPGLALVGRSSSSP